MIKNVGLSAIISLEQNENNVHRNAGLVIHRFMFKSL